MNRLSASFRCLFASVTAGCGWLALGCLMLVVGYPTHLNDSNIWLLFSLLIILAGAAIIVAAYRRRSKY